MSHNWQTGLYDCTNAGPICAHGFSLNSITWGETRYRMLNRDDVEMKNFNEVNGPCVGCSIIGILPGMPCVMQMIQRRQLREKLDIEGNFAKDCITSFFCHCCGLVQEDMEAKAWQERRGVYAESAAKVQPVPQTQMQYAASSAI